MPKEVKISVLNSLQLSTAVNLRIRDKAYPPLTADHYTNLLHCAVFGGVVSCHSGGYCENIKVFRHPVMHSLSGNYPDPACRAARQSSISLIVTPFDFRRIRR